jgi:Transposase and inactivated derivatives
MILHPDAMKELFLAIIRRAKKKYNFEIENFCIMGNHFHMIIRPGEGEYLSSIMQWILSVFAMAYNKVNGLTGHVWGERFHSSIINSIRELIHTFAYIDLNPVVSGLASSPGEWPYCGLSHRRHGQFDIIAELSPEILSEGIWGL